MLASSSSQKSTATQDPPGLVEDQEFWFSDGNVVLIAGNTAFRVHKGVVSRNSEVFNDLFTVPQPADEETRFGCSVVHLSESPIELGYFLRVLYDGKKSYLKTRDEKVEFNEVAALVRLAQKYQIEELREDGLERLKTCFTDDFDQWETSLALGRTCSSVLKLEPTDAIAAVNLAHHTDTLSMLPTALYMRCALKSHQLLKGVARPDGTMEQLSPEDLERCLDARSFLLNRNIVRDNEAFSSVSDLCTTRPECSNILVRARDHRMMNSVGPKAYQALRSPDEFSESLAKHYGLCESCLDLVKSKAVLSRKGVWRELPGFFGLDIPDWGRNELP